MLLLRATHKSFHYSLRSLELNQLKKLMYVHKINSREFFVMMHVWVRAEPSSCACAYLLQGGAEPLHIAARCGRLDIVQLLIEKYKVSPDTLTEVGSSDGIQSLSIII